jgi:hypothetical protein
MFWQWLFVGSTVKARITGLIAASAVALYLHNAHEISNYFAYPIGFCAYIIVRLLWGGLGTKP